MLPDLLWDRLDRLYTDSKVETKGAQASVDFGLRVAFDTLLVAEGLHL